MNPYDVQLFNTKPEVRYKISEEEALQIGQDYIKKGMKKLTSPSTFKEYYSL